MFKRLEQYMVLGAMLACGVGMLLYSYLQLMSLPQ